MGVFWIIGVLTILGMAVYFMIEKNEYGYWDFSISAWCITIPIGILSFLLSFILMMGVSLILPSEERLYKEENIQALKDTTRIQGQAYLFTSTVNETDYYHYITKTPRGISKAKADIKDSFIIEDNSVAPSVKIYRNEYTWKISGWLFGDEAWGKDIYEFYVPEGTVIADYYDVGVE